MTRRPAAAKLNLALVVGWRREDGKHEVATVLQRLDLSDRVSLERCGRLRVEGFPDDTLVTRALVALAGAAGTRPRWRVAITKRIPVAAGLGGGSSDAATALRLANATLDQPLDHRTLRAIASGLGADVPFFLESGPQLGEGDGSTLTALDLPQDYWVVLLLPTGSSKPSTATVYARFDGRGGEAGYAERRARLLGALATVRSSPDLSALPPNDLGSSPLADELRAAGAFRADVSGAGPIVYGLFMERRVALDAQARVRPVGRTWIAVPAWYG